MFKKFEEWSIDIGVQEMLAKAEQEGIETAFHRGRANEPRCKFGILGVCCKRCLEGPCRIVPGKGPQTGVCGATADAIVARNLLTTVTEGATPHIEHAREVVITLLEACEGKAPYEIRGKEKLLDIAQKLGLTVDGKDIKEVGKEVALKALEDYSKQYGVLNWLKLRGEEKTIKTWEELGILPVNAHLEIAKAINRQAMGCDADPVNILLGIMTMALVEGYSGLHLSTDLQDVLFGVPAPVKAEYKLGVIKEGYVNIAAHGHIPMLSDKVVEWAEKLEEEAKKAGAKGINVVGVCCTGNEVLMRKGIPVATNFASQEMPIITGAIDVMVVDAQCIMPSLQKVAECYHTEIITTLPYVKIPGATHVEFHPESADEGAEEIVKRAINNFGKRDKSKIQIPDDKTEAYAGFSVEAIIEALKKVDENQPLKPLVDNIANGNILGVAAIVGCTNPKVRQDWYNTEVAKHLLKNNVMVVSTGCSAHSLAKNDLMNPKGLKYCGDSLKEVLVTIGQANGLEALPPALHMGSCVDNSRVDDLLVAVAKYLDVPVKALPAVGSCPETHSPKAIAIGAYFIAQGVDVHVGVVPNIEGSEVVSKALMAEKGEFAVTTDELFGAKLIYELDPEKAAKEMIRRMCEKRKALGLVVPEII